MSLFLLGNFAQLDEQNNQLNTNQLNTNQSNTNQSNTNQLEEQIGGYNFNVWRTEILKVKGKNTVLSESKEGKIWYLQLKFNNDLIMRIISSSQHGCKVIIGHEVNGDTLAVRNNFNYDFRTIGFSYNGKEQIIKSDDVTKDNFFEARLKPLINSVNTIPKNPIPVAPAPAQVPVPVKPITVAPALAQVPAQLPAQVPAPVAKVPTVADVLAKPAQQPAPPAKQPAQQPAQQVLPVQPNQPIQQTQSDWKSAPKRSVAPVLVKATVCNYCLIDGSDCSKLSGFCLNKKASCKAILPSDKSQTEYVEKGSVLMQAECTTGSTDVSNLLSNNLYYEGIVSRPNEHTFIGRNDINVPVIEFNCEKVYEWNKKLNRSEKFNRKSLMPILNINEPNSLYRAVKAESLINIAESTKYKRDFDEFKRNELSDLLNKGATSEIMINSTTELFRNRLQGDITKEGNFRSTVNGIENNLRAQMVIQYRLLINNLIRSQYGITQLFGVNNELIRAYELSVGKKATWIDEIVGKFVEEVIDDSIDDSLIRRDVPKDKGGRITSLKQSNGSELAINESNRNIDLLKLFSIALEPNTINKILVTKLSGSYGINGKIESDIKELCQRLSGRGSKPNAADLIDFVTKLEQLKLQHYKKFDDAKRLNAELSYDEDDEEEINKPLSEQKIKMDKLLFEYRKEQTGVVKLGYVLDNTCNIRLLKQHLVVDPSLINFTYQTSTVKLDSNRRPEIGADGKKIYIKSNIDNLISMFDLIKCTRFWFDVYVEGMFYNLIYPGNNNRESAKALSKIKTELLKVSAQSQPLIAQKIERFENEIKQRQTVFEQKKLEFNPTEILYKIIGNEKETLSRSSEVIEFKGKIRTGEQGNRATDGLKPLSRFVWPESSIALLIDKIGTKNEISKAIQATRHQILLDRYLSGETLTSTENTLLLGLLTKAGKNMQDIDAVRQRNSQVAITDASHIAIATTEAVGVAVPVSRAEKEADINKKILIVNLLNAIKSKCDEIIAKKDKSKSKVDDNKAICEHINVLISSPSNSDLSTFQSIVSKMPKEITSVQNAPQNSADLYNLIISYKGLSAEFKVKVDEYNVVNERKESKSKKDKALQPIINAMIAIIFPDQIGKKATQPAQTAQQVQSGEDDIEFAKIPRERVLLPLDGTFVLDKWQWQFIQTIKNKKSCLLTTPTGVGKTFTMMTCIDALIKELNEKGQVSKIVYVAPSIQLALQTFANIKKTNTSQAIKVSLITDTVIYKVDESQIYVGTPVALSNYFSSNDMTFEIGLFDEIHLILPSYARNVSEQIRIRETIKLLGKCTQQFIGASATIPNTNELFEYIKSKCSVPKTYEEKDKFSNKIVKESYVSPIIFDTIEPKPVLPNHFEHVFNGSTFVKLQRNESGLVLNEPPIQEQTSTNVSTENFINLIKTINTQPALVFEVSEIHAFTTFQQMVAKLNEENSRKYPNKISLAHTLRELIVKYNHLRDKNEVEFKKLIKKVEHKVKPYYNTQNETLNNILDIIKVTIVKILCDYSKRETYTTTQKQITPDIKQSGVKTIPVIKQELINILKYNSVIPGLIDDAYTTENNFIESIETQGYNTAIKYLKTGITSFSAELMEIMEAYAKYKKFMDDNVMVRLTDYVKPLEFYLLSIGNELKFVDNNNLSQRIISAYNLINPLSTSLITAENISIKHNVELNQNEIDNNDIKKIAELYILGSEFGITCIVPNLPWFIQIEVMKSISVSNDDHPEVGFVFTSKDMSIGIDYPLKSVIIKAPNGTPLNNTIKHFEPTLLVQMSGRCGRRNVKNNGRDGEIYYYGVANYKLANKKQISEDNLTKDDLTEQITRFDNINLIGQKIDATSTITAKDLIVDIFTLSRSSGEKNIVATYTGLPIISELNKINSWLNVFNLDTIKDIVVLETTTEQIRFSLGIIVEHILLLDPQFRSLGKANQDKKMISVIDSIYKIYKAENINLSIDQMNELSNIIEKSISLLLYIYDSNCKVKLTLSIKNKLEALFKNLINILHGVEMSLLIYNNQSTTQRSASPSTSTSTDKKGIINQDQQNNFSLLSFLMSPFN